MASAMWTAGRSRPLPCPTTSCRCWKPCAKSVEGASAECAMKGTTGIPRGIPVVPFGPGSLRPRLEDVAQHVRCPAYPGQLQVSQALRVGHDHGPEVVPVLEQELDLLPGHAVRDRVAEAVGAVFLAVDA